MRLKFCFKINRFDITAQEFKTNHEERNNLLKINHELNDELTHWKDKIRLNKNWDCSKRMSNQYEQIFSCRNPLKKKPISRAYFKLWEILMDFPIFEKIKLNDNCPTSVHLAEGPGGFIDCLVDYYKEKRIIHDKIHGITLMSNETKVPSWKLNDSFLKRNNIELHDKISGNLYNSGVVEKFIDNVRSISKNSSFITADGGFDFSSDFNNQENQNYRLMLSQIYCALSLQKENGFFILKVFDLFSEKTIHLLHDCLAFYKFMYIIKPNTSRPANSEKYILFCNYVDNFDENHTRILEYMKTFIEKNENDLVFEPDYTKTCETLSFMIFLQKITEYNVYYTFKQISHIKKTLSVSVNKERMDHILNNNLDKCKKWCSYYLIR
jgi:23S rRNA U2552 (ribose-2'-O)-methylase RlmE/FtsJ